MQKFYSDAIYQIGNTARIRDKIEKAQNGKNVTLAYIGGSITEGGRTDTCYVSRSHKYFADTFGTGNNVSLINAGNREHLLRWDLCVRKTICLMQIPMLFSLSSP